ncbi:DNA replication/repair protein RecF [Candidatus Dependentiae bacterium]|nr:MAG: DNA replication/repair protein RecF [Candidatus Dependentiae bacterium]
MDNCNLKVVACKIELKNFRCFKDTQFDIDAPLIIIEGGNGTGKTSLIEALYFASHVRSFKTAHVENIIMQNEQAFFLKLCFNENTFLYIGVEKKKKIIKINQKTVKSLTEINENINAISIVETDIQIIQGGPSDRRFFLDQTLVLLDDQLVSEFKKLKIVLKNRNDFLSQRIQNKTLYDILTEQLFACSLKIQLKRHELLECLAFQINKLISEFNLSIKTVSFAYNPKIDTTDKNNAFEKINNYKNNEYMQCRSLFGAHLDDFSILCGNFDTRKQCSRGQQKLLTILLKISAAKLYSRRNDNIIFLIDDFITDLDETNIRLVMNMLCSLKCQLIFTTPLALFLEKYIIKNFNVSIIRL